VYTNRKVQVPGRRRERRMYPTEEEKSTLLKHSPGFNGEQAFINSSENYG
jgi:hypothetical protein